MGQSLYWESEADDLGIPDGDPFTQDQLNVLLGNKPDSRAAYDLRVAGTGPPFIRVGRKHSRVLYPRPGVRAWLRERMFTSQSEANAATD